MVQACDEINNSEFLRVSNFETNNAIIYKKDYVAGYYCNHYEVDLKEAYEKARGEMRENIKADIVSSYRADVVSHLNVDTSISNIKYKYVLLPLYLGSYQFKKKNYRLVMNGINKNIAGKYPLSAWKITITSILSAGLIALIVFLIVKFTN